MAEIPLKTWPESFEAVVQGRKTHEWRKDDRVPPFAIGDVLMLREFFPCELCKGTGRARCGAAEVCCPEPHGKFSGREHKVYVNFITRGEFGVPDGWICMSIGRDYIPPPARDPRADPKPGDRVQSVGGRETCYVLEVFSDPRRCEEDLGPPPHVHSRMDGPLGRRHATMSLETWRKWSGAGIPGSLLAGLQLRPLGT